MQLATELLWFIRDGFGGMTVKVLFASAAVTLALTSATYASADEFPARRAGLWEVTISSPGSQAAANSAKICIDEATESALMSLAGATSKKLCSRLDIHFDGAEGMIDSVCKFGTSTQTSHSRIVFNGDSAYHVETTAHYDPPLYGKTEGSMIDDAKWTGPCPDDMKPGDMVTSTGIRMHIDSTADQ
jgi:uncharacterized protein DUF3617